MRRRSDDNGQVIVAAAAAMAAEMTTSLLMGLDRVRCTRTSCVELISTISIKLAN